MLRTNSACPASSSNRRICALTVDCVELSSLAAFVNPAFSATATKLRSNSVSKVRESQTDSVFFLPLLSPPCLIFREPILICLTLQVCTRAWLDIPWQVGGETASEGAGEFWGVLG